VRKLGSAIAAVAYREAVWFKRFVADYVVAWVLPIFFGLGVIFLPSSMGSVSSVLSRMSSVLGTKVTLSEAVAYGISLSAIISLVGAIVGDVIQTTVSEARIMGILDSVLVSVDLGSYVTAVAIVRSVLLGFFSTIYLPIALVAVLGLEGLRAYAFLALPLLASSIALGLYATSIALPVAFFVNISRPWTLSSVLVPAILAGAGLYIPAYMVPAILRAIALTTPVPELCEALRILILKGLSGSIATIASIICGLLAAYVAIVAASARACGKKVARGG